MEDSVNVVEILRREAERASHECQRTRRNLKYLRLASPNDGEISNAERLHDSAVEALALSLERLNQFIGAVESVHRSRDCSRRFEKATIEGRPGEGIQNRLVTFRGKRAPPD